jgi:hypothetical protein
LAVRRDRTPIEVSFLFAWRLVGVVSRLHHLSTMSSGVIIQEPPVIIPVAGAAEAVGNMVALAAARSAVRRHREVGKDVAIVGIDFLRAEEYRVDCCSSCPPC